MTDFSIRKVSVNPELKTSNDTKTPFAKAKDEYNAKIKKLETSDFANSPVGLNEKLTELKKLKGIAEQENLEEEIAWIEEEITFVHQKLNEKPQAVNDVPYYKPPISTTNFEQIAQENENAKFDKLVEKYGTTNEQAKDLISTLKETGINAYQTEQIIIGCKDSNEELSPKLMKSVLQLIQGEFKEHSIQQILNELIEFDSETKENHIPDKILESCLFMKKNGTSEIDSIKFTKFVRNGNFADEKAVQKSIVTLHKAGIDSDSLLKILDNLAYTDIDVKATNVENPKKLINQSTIKTIATLKQTFTTTRKNEVEERHSELGQLAQEIIDMGNDLMFLKNGKIEFISPKEDNSPQALRERYLNMTNETEDNILLNLSKNHKVKGGKIDTNYIRVLSSLRNAGIVYDELEKLAEFSLSKDGSINFDTVSNISKLKEHGALSKDIKLLLDNCEKNENNQYSTLIMDDICDLSSYVIPGENIVELLPFVRDNEEAKAFIEYVSQFFENKNNVVALSTTAKLSDGSADQNKMDTISALLRDKYDNVDGKFVESKFVENINSLIEVSQDKETKEVNDDAAGVISILSGNGSSFEEIQKGIEMCKNKDDIVDEKLAQILWDMTIQKASLEEISALISICTDEEKNVDTQKADMIISLLQNKFSKDDIAKLLIK